MGVTINNESTNQQQQQSHRLRTDSSQATNAFYWCQIFALDSAITVVEAHGGFLTIAMYHHRLTILSNKRIMMEQRKGLTTLR